MSEGAFPPPSPSPTPLLIPYNTEAAVAARGTECTHTQSPKRKSLMRICDLESMSAKVCPSLMGILWGTLCFKIWRSF